MGSFAQKTRAPVTTPVARAARAGKSAETMASGRTGRPLDAPARARYEPLFHWSLADVRIHTDARAAASAEALDAEAYTVGRDIFFNSGAYRPGESSASICWPTNWRMRSSKVTGWDRRRP